MRLDDFLARLDRVKRNGRGVTALCPGHEDQARSLSVGRGADGRILVKCFAGCAVEDIAGALGLELRDLFAESERRVARGNGRPPPPAVTVAALARAKGLDPAFLGERFGLVDLPDGRGVGIPYRDAAGHTVAMKKRTALVAKAGSRWPTGTPLLAYVDPPSLARARETGRLVLVEGESDTWTAAAQGLPVLGLPGATTASTLLAAHLDGVREVYVCADADEAGTRCVVGVRARLAALGYTGRVVVVAMPDGCKDVNDLHRRDPERFVAAFQAAAKAAQPIEATGAPESTPDAREPWAPPVPFAHLDLPPFPTDALPAWLRAFVEALATATQTPAALPGLLTMSALGTAMAKRLVVRVRDGWTEPVNVFTVTALPPGTRKSPVFREVAAPVLAVEQAEVERLRPLIAQRETEYRIAEATLKRAQDAAAKAEGDDRTTRIAEAVQAAQDLSALAVPVSPRLIADDCTPERLASLLRDQSGRMAVLSAEGTIFEVMKGRYAGNGAANIEVFLKGHTGDDLRVDRVGRPTEFVEQPALTLGLAVQPDVIRGLTEQPAFRGRGLLARFVYALPESVLGARDLDAPPVPAHVRVAYHARMRALLALPARADDQGRPVPLILTLSPAADAALRAFEREIEPRLAPFGDLGPMADWGSKLCGLVARLAGLLHAATVVGRSEDCEDSASDVQEQSLRTPLSVETMEAAIGLGRFAVPHAKAAYAEMGADAAVEGAKVLLRWIEKTGVATVTKREAFQWTKGRFQTVNDLEPALARLVDHGYLRPAPIADRPGPGRKPSPTYEVNPLSLAQNPHNPQNGRRGANCEDSEDSETPSTSAARSAPRRAASGAGGSAEPLGGPVEADDL